MAQTFVGTFEIPEELARQLSELLLKEIIREKLLSNVTNDPEKFDEVERILMPIVSKIELIKTKITTEYVPKEYSSENYMWNYNGYDISGTTVDIFQID